MTEQELMRNHDYFWIGMAVGAIIAACLFLVLAFIVI